MAGALLNKALESLEELKIKASDIAVFDPDKEKVAAFAAKGASAASSAEEIFESSEIALLGVKPQIYSEILSKKPAVGASTVISIMAGVKIATLRKYLGGEIGIARVMPNTPARVGKGTAAVAFDKVSARDKAFILKLLNASGLAVEIAEDKFDAVTSVSGSGPAYVYMFASGMIKAGIEGGLTYGESRTLALQTIEGAAALAKSTPETDLDNLVQSVCSKGGTTIEAVEVFKKRGLEEIIAEGIKACREKSKALSDKY